MMVATKNPLLPTRTVLNKLFANERISKNKWATGLLVYPCLYYFESSIEEADGGVVTAEFA